ncbi:MAG: tetratricopeptide repeat protein, partial [Polyangiaceae bacterium]
MRLRFLAVSLACVPLLVARPCFGAGPDAEWTTRGIEHYKRGDYQGAREAFARAYELSPDASTLINLSLAEVESGHALDAARHMRQYLQDPLAVPEKLEAVRSKWLPRAEAQIGRLAVEGPAGADVSVDGRAEGRTPLPDPIDVEVGDHEISMRLGSWSRSLHASARVGQVASVQFVAPEPTVAPAAPPAPTAPPRTTTEPRAPEPPPPAHEGGFPPAKTATVVTTGTLALASAAIGFGFTMASNSNSNEAAILRQAIPSGGCAGATPA